MSNKKVVLVTGALTGIGKATATAFAKEGARLVISGRNEEKGQALAKELRSFGSEVEFIKADVRFEKDVQNLVEKTVKQFGRLDVAVNNAGTEGTPGPIIEQTPETYAETFDTNVLGVLLSMKHEIRAMSKTSAGSIINISSVVGKKGFPGASVYVASKHAVEGLTKAAALEVAGTGIRVNNVAPGPIETDMIHRFAGDNVPALAEANPSKRLGRPEEIAEMVLFLASDKAPYITGQTFGVDGGMLA